MKHRSFSEAEDVMDCLAEAVDVVAAGGVLLIPTESFYGLAADPRSTDAVRRVNALKGRPSDLGLPVVCCDWEQVDALVEIPSAHRVRLGRIWPAALTVVAQCRCDLAAARRGTLAVRIPDHEHLRVVLYRTGALTATSANRHGDPPCVTVAEALSSILGEPDLVLDAGKLPGGRVSTMVDLASAEARVIRSGAVAWEQRFGTGEWSDQEC
jgi:L-threonylcarbamoyladenylate synthase